MISVGGTFTVLDIKDGLVQYRHDTNSEFATSDSFNFTVSDQTTTLPQDTFLIKITLTNDPPSVIDPIGPLTVLEGGTGTITTSLLNENDPDNVPHEMQYSITVPPANGQILVNGTGPATTFTQAQIDAGIVTYRHDDSETISDQFTFSLADGDPGVSPFVGLFPIIVTPVNDNKPIFTGHNFTIAEFPTTQNNDEFLQLSGTDSDTSGTYSWHIVSDITGNNGVVDNGLFEVVTTGDGKTANLRVLNAAVLDFDNLPHSYTFEVSFRDGVAAHEDPDRNIATVTVTLTNENDNPPSVVPQTVIAQVPEDAQQNDIVLIDPLALPTQVFEISATDPDHDPSRSEMTDFHWEIVSSNYPQDIFAIQPNAADSSIANLVVADSDALDYEAIFDQSTQTAQIELVVQVYDGVPGESGTLSSVQVVQQRTILVDIMNIIEPPEISVSLLPAESSVADGSRVDFGITPATTPVSRTFRVFNSGDAPLHISNFVPPTGFSISIPPGNNELGAGESTTFTVQFDATAIGSLSGELTFETNEPADTTNVDGLIEDLYNITLSGEVSGEPSHLEFSVDPGAVFRQNGIFDFGTTVETAPVTYRFRLGNVGDGDLSITDIAVPTGFAIDPTSANANLPTAANPWILSVGDVRQVEVSLVGDSASLIGHFFGNLVVRSDDPGAPQFSVHFNGEINSGNDVTIVDNEDSSFSFSSGWQTTSDSGFGLSYLYNGDSSAADDTATATWNFGSVPAGVYSIAATWAGGNWPVLSSTRPFTNNYGTAIYDVVANSGGISATSSHTLDHFDRPREFEADDTTWELITTNAIEAGPLSVTLRAPQGAEQLMIADAVRLERLGPTTDVIGLPAGRATHTFDPTLNDNNVFRAWETDGGSELAREWTVEFGSSPDQNGVPTVFGTTTAVTDGANNLGTLFANLDGTVTLNFNETARTSTDPLTFVYRLVHRTGVATDVTSSTLYFAADAPASAADRFSTSHGRPLTFDAVWNDRDPEGDGLQSELPSPDNGVLNFDNGEYSILDRGEFHVGLPTSANQWDLEFDWLDTAAGPITISGLDAQPEDDLPQALVNAGVINRLADVSIQEVNNDPRIKRIQFSESVLQAHQLKGFTVSVSAPATAESPVTVAHERGKLLNNSDGTWTFKPDQGYFRLMGTWTEEFLYGVTDGKNRGHQVQKTMIDVTNSAPQATVTENVIAFYDVPAPNTRRPVGTHNAVPIDVFDEDGDPLYYVSVSPPIGAGGNFQASDPIQNGILDFYAAGTTQAQVDLLPSPIFQGIAQYRITDGHSFSPVLTTHITTTPNRLLAGSTLPPLVIINSSPAARAIDVTNQNAAIELSPEWRITSTATDHNPERPVTSVGGVNVDLESGDASFDVILDSDLAPGVNGAFALHYDSGSVVPQPVIQSIVHRPAATEKVTEIRATLRWAFYDTNNGDVELTELDDDYRTAIRYLTSAGVDDTEIAVTLQAAEQLGKDIVSGTRDSGLYRWFIDSSVSLDDGTTVSLSSTGDAFLHSPQANPTSPFRGLPRGWTVSGIPDLLIQANDQSASSRSERIEDDQVMLVFPDGGVRRFKAPEVTTQFDPNSQHSAPWRPITMENRLTDREVFGTLVRIAAEGNNNWGDNDTWLYTAVDGTKLQFNGNGNIVSIDSPQRPPTQFGYTSGGLIRSITAPDTAVTTFRYNTNNQLDQIRLPGGATEVDRRLNISHTTADRNWAFDEFTFSDDDGIIERQKFLYGDSSLDGKLVQLRWGHANTKGYTDTTIQYDPATGVVAAIQDGSSLASTYGFQASAHHAWLPGTAVWDGQGNVAWTNGTPHGVVATGDARAALVAPAVNGQVPGDYWQLDNRGRIVRYEEHVDTAILSTQTWSLNAFGDVTEHTDELDRKTRFTRSYPTDTDGEKPVYFGAITEVFYGYPQATTSYLDTDDGGYIVQSLDARQIASAVFFDNKNRARISAGVNGTKTEWVYNTFDIGTQTLEDILTAELVTWQSSKLDDDGNVDSNLHDSDAQNTVIRTTDYSDHQLDRLPRTVTVSDNRGSDVNETIFSFTPSGEILTQANIIDGSTVSTSAFTYFGHNNAVQSFNVKDVNSETLAAQAMTYYTSGLTETTYDGVGYTQYAYNDRGLTSAVRSGAFDNTSAAFNAAYLTSYSYHDNGSLETMTAPDGHTETMAFDLAARRNTVTTDRVKASGIDLTAGSTSQRIITGYDDAGRTTFMSNSLTESSVDYTKYDRYDRVLETSDRVFLEADGSPVFVKNTYTYDADGNLLQSKLHGDTDNNPNDAGLAPTSYDYDRFGYTSRYEVLATGGAVMEMHNDALGQTIRDVEYRQTPVITAGAVSGYTESSIVSQASFDGYGRLRRSETPEGNSVDLAYSVSTTGVNIFGLGDRLYPTVTATTSLRNNLTGTPDQIVTTSWTDALGRPLASKDPSGTVVYTDYNLAGRLTDTRLLVPAGGSNYDTLRQSRSTVDHLGRTLVETVVDPASFSLGQGPGTGSQEVRYQYPTQANYNAFDDTPATYWDTRWDVAVSNRVDVGAFGTIPQSRLANDSLGNSVRIDAPDPDRTGPLTSPVTRTDYDYLSASGYSSTTIDPLGRQWKTDLNSRGQVLQNFDAGGVKQTSASYDTAGRVKKHQDALNNFTESTFNYATGQVRTSSVPQELGDPVTATSSMIYDSAGNLLRLTDPENNTTVWEYDDLGRPEKETIELPVWDASGSVIDGSVNLVEREWVYNGLTTIYTDRNDRTITYGSDPSTRTSTETWSDGRTITATANEAGQLTQTVDTSGAKEWTQGFEYDVLGRLDYNTFDYSLNGSSEYDTLAIHTFTDTGVRNELLFFLNDEQQIQQTAIVDDLNRITTLTQENGDSGLEQQVVFNYRTDSSLDDLQRTEITDSATTPIAFTDFVYFDSSSSNIRGELQTIHHQYQGGGTTITKYDYTYDNAHRIDTFDSSRDGLNDFGYDAENQLETATLTGETYDYDDNGNRTTVGYDTRQHNLLVEDPNFKYVYDKEGNRIRRIDNSATAEVVHYDWDHRNRLIRIRTEDSGGTETKRVEYDYNVANLRIEKRVSTDGGTSFESTERYALDGSDVVLVFDENDTIEHTYFHGAAVDQIFSDDSAVGELLWALSDHQGTVRDWISADDADSNESDPTQHVTYSAFGEILSATDESTLPRYSYTGREWDADADLYYYRNRWYDPVIGKFANDDPIGFSAGDRNLQRYVGNNAPNMRDPEGLSGGPNFPLVVDSQGRSFIIQSLRASGDQKTDLAWANKWIKDNVDSGFKGAKALKGTWHHKSFNEKTGTFLMELVDSKAHKAGHAGAFADYLEWISKTVKGGKIDKLSKLQKSALFAALKNKGTLGRLAIDKYLSKEAVSVAVKKLEKEGWEVVVSKSGERGVKLSGKLIGKGVSRTFLVTVTKVGAKYGLTVVFAAAAAKNAYAETGEVSAALEAAGRDVVMAEMVEGRRSVCGSRGREDGVFGSACRRRLFAKTF